MSYRLFLGLALPDGVADQLVPLCSGVPGARWVGRENLHITLRFIGEVDGSELDEIHAAVAALTAPAFDVRLGGVGRFGTGQRTRAVWAGVDPQDDVAFLAAKIDHALVQTGLEPERRKFKPHVTLARLKETSEGRVLHWLEGHGGFRTNAFTVDHFVLFRSHLTQAGAQYEALAEYSLQT